MHIPHRFLIVAALLTSASVAAAQPPRYRMTVLGYVGGDNYTHNSGANGIDAQGTVVGISTDADDKGQLIRSPVLWQYGATVRLERPAGWDSGAHAINAHGVIVGGAIQHADGSHARAVTWVDGRSSFLPGGTSSSGAYAINDHGQIVGNVTDVDQPSRAALWENGELRALATPANALSAVGTTINNKGEIGGAAFVQLEFLWKPQVWNNAGEPAELPLAQGTTGGGVMCMNDQGLIGGWGTTDEQGFYSTAVLWINGAPIDLFAGSMVTSGTVNDINEVGDAIGTFWDSDTTSSFLWHEGNLYDLSTLVEGGPDFGSLLVFSMNDSGMIVGNAVIDGSQQAIVLTPIPAPATAALLGVGLIAGRRRRQ